MEKNMLKNVYICMTDSLYCIAEMNTIVNPLYLHKIKKFF